jgi:hypothetical protein
MYRHLWGVRGLFAISLSILIIACGGGGGGSDSQSTSVPASTPPPTSTLGDLRTWGAEQTLTGVGGRILSPIPSIGTPSITWGAWHSDTIVKQTYANGGWQTVLSLPGLPNDAISIFASPSAMVNRGGVTATAWVKHDYVADTHETWVHITDAGHSVATTRVSNGYVENSALLVATADGGITAIWGEQDQPHTVGGPLLSRHWTPVSGWGPVVVIEPSPSIIEVRVIQQMPDGRALFFYQMMDPHRTTSRDAYHLWARIIDASGVVGAATQLDDVSQGFSAEWGIHFALRGNDVVTAWLQVPASGDFCVVSRVFKNNAWSSPTCVNASPLVSKTKFQPRLQVSASGQVWLAWYGDTVYVSTLGANDTWSVPESVGAPKAGEFNYSHFDVAACQDGSAAVAWQTNTSAGVGLAMRVRDSTGIWGQRLDLAQPVTGTLDAVLVSTDASCNWTTIWSIHDKTDRISARRFLKSGGLQAPFVLAENITLPNGTSNGYRIFAATIALTVEPTGPAVVVWDEQPALAIKWRRLE